MSQLREGQRWLHGCPVRPRRGHGRGRRRKFERGPWRPAPWPRWRRSRRPPGLGPGHCWLRQELADWNLRTILPVFGRIHRVAPWPSAAVGVAAVIIRQVVKVVHVRPVRCPLLAHDSCAGSVHMALIACAIACVAILGWNRRRHQRGREQHRRYREFVSGHSTIPPTSA